MKTTEQVLAEALEKTFKPTKDRVKQIIQDLLDKQPSFGSVKISHCEIRFDLTGKTIGQFCVAKDKFWLRFNPILLTANPHEIEPTVVHELAHQIVYQMTFQKLGYQVETSHGPLWQSIMRILGQKPEVCHTVNVTNYKNPRKIKKLLS